MRHKENRPKPGQQRRMGFMHNRAGGNRSLMLAARTLIQLTAFQKVERIVLTFGATEAVRPTDLKQMLSACVIRMKLLLKSL